MVANPYAEQLSSFRASVPSARRGLRDIFGRRRQHVAQGQTDIRALLDRALGTQRVNNAAGLADIDLAGAQGRSWAEQYGYELDRGQRGDIATIVGRGINPLRDYASQTGGLNASYLNDAMTANSDWYANMAEGLKREEPAAVSELESGITDTVGFLGQQSAAFNQQQAYNTQLQQYLNQMAAVNSGGSGRNSPWTQNQINFISSRWGVTVGGYRAQGSVPGSDHPKGLAADAMIRNAAQGNQIAQYFVANAGAHAVKYIIWNRRIWTPAGGWRRYSGPSPHTDHVHISFLR